MNNSRRGFLKNLGVFGGLAGAAYIGYREATEEKPDKEVIDKLNNGSSLLTLTSGYDPEPVKTSWYSGYTIGLPTFKTQKTASLQVGYDGKLYVKENDVWRKV